MDYKVSVVCAHCGKEKTISRTNKKKKNYCDQKCSMHHRHKEGYVASVFFNKGTDHPAWKGGRRKSSNGYIEVHKPDHHRARGNGYVYEHIIVMEEKLGKKVKRHDGHIHHRDGNKTNNHPDNLTLMDGAEHISMHMLGKIKKQKPSKSKKDEVRCVPKEKLPRGYYYLRIND